MPTYLLLYLAACLPVYLSVLIYVTPLGHQVLLCHSQMVGTLPTPLHPSDTQRLLWASAVAKKSCVHFSAAIIRDKDRKKNDRRLSLLLCTAVAGTRERNQNQLHRKSLPCNLIKPFKVIANFKNTVYHIAFDNTKSRTC